MLWLRMNLLQDLMVLHKLYATYLRLLVAKKITPQMSAKQYWGGMQMGKGYAGQANKAGNKAEAASICEEGFKQVESVYL